MSLRGGDIRSCLRGESEATPSTRRLPPSTAAPHSDRGPLLRRGLPPGDRPEPLLRAGHSPTSTAHHERPDTTRSNHLATEGYISLPYHPVIPSVSTIRTQHPSEAPPNRPPMPVKRTLKAPNHQQKAVQIARFDQYGHPRAPLRTHPPPAPNNQVGKLPLNGCEAPAPSGILRSSATRTAQAQGPKPAPPRVSTRCARRSVHSSAFRVRRMVRVHHPTDLRDRDRMVPRDDRVHLRGPAFSRSSHEGGAG